MSTPYARIDLASLPADSASPASPTSPTSPTNDPRNLALRWFVPPLAVLLSIAQSVLWIWANDVRRATLAGTLIPVLGFVLLVLAVLVCNPALRCAARLLPRGRCPRPFGRAELVTLFAAMLVTAGISTFGLAEQLVPQIASPFDPHWNTPQRGWTSSLKNINRSLYITDPEAIRQYREGLGEGPPDSAGWLAAWRHYAHVARAIPWSIWLWPLSSWLVFVAAAYGLFYSLAHLTLPLWARREQLIFPLAKLPESVLPEADRPLGVVPALFRGPGFWFGFAIVFSVLTWNGLVQSGFFPAGIAPITLGMHATGVAKTLHDFTLGRLGIAALVLFTATSLAFLIPAEMSFSVWFYYLYGRAVVLIAIWLGYGQSTYDFPSDYFWNTNISAAQGSGAMFAFSAISLSRCLLDFRRLAAGRTLGRKALIAAPILGLVASMAVLTAWLQWNNLGWGWSLLFVLVMTLLTVGLMRIVAESGIYWIQAHTGFFHLYKMFGLSSLLAPAVVAPIFPIYALLFLDVKCLLAPNLLNAAKLRESVGGNRATFHVTLILSIASSVAASILFAIFLAYLRGADRMHYWFYGICQNRVFDTARDIALRSPASANLVNTGWFGFGCVWVVLTMLLRRQLFWVPHPLGFIMLSNPLMDQLWLSFLLAWIFKKLVVKYGGKATFDKARAVAIGAITGELTAIVVWIAIALLAGIDMPYITIDRYGP
ncbi:MAG: hypothetical protein NTW19_15080 [Planctomycetota bacterium]|nr:hypothetical protein [Planctomycetota bacterium]